MGELYSITGLFYEAFPGISPWGGHFIRENDYQIDGQLVDLYGPSKLEGILDDRTLSFRKRYEGCNHEQEFEYHFSPKEGIWLGEYSSKRGYAGRSICKINLCLSQIDFKKVDLRNPEGFAAALIDRMVQTGRLELFIEADTGEEMLRPSE